MEKGIDAYIKEQFHLPPVDIRTYSPLTLAYIGDGIYDLIIRSIIVGKGNTRGIQTTSGDQQTGPRTGTVRDDRSAASVSE